MQRHFHHGLLGLGALDVVEDDAQDTLAAERLDGAVDEIVTTSVPPG